MNAVDPPGRAPALRTPDLPRTAKVREVALRTGWTTGACAAAAAKAAALLLVGGTRGPAPGVVDIPLPVVHHGDDVHQRPPGLSADGARACLPVLRVLAGPASPSGADRGAVTWAEAVVVKFAGDDPDVTDGAHITVRLERCAADAGQPPERPADGPWGGPGDGPGHGPGEDPGDDHPADPHDHALAGLRFVGGPGVGAVTRPGLGLPVGEPAINGTPRRMIAAAVGEVIRLDSGRPLRCTVSVPGGEVMARKTTNARLGIVGGISILGTTGVVRPFSTASWRASVLQAIDVVAAQGRDTVVLATGGRTERAAMTLLPDLPEACFVEVGDFTGAALERAAERGLRRCVFVGMAGKLAKLAAGVMMTHYTRSKVDLDVLACLTADVGGSADVVTQVRAANTGRHAFELWSAHGLERAAGDALCAQVAANLARHAGQGLQCEVVLVSFDDLAVVGASPGWTGPRATSEPSEGGSAR